MDPRNGKPKCEDLPWGHVWTYDLIGNMRLDGPGGPDTGLDTTRGGPVTLMQYQYPGERLGIPAFGAPSYGYGPYPATDANGNVILDPNGEIGRASCRERVCSVRVYLGGCRFIKKKNKQKH